MERRNFFKLCASATAINNTAVTLPVVFKTGFKAKAEAKNTDFEIEPGIRYALLKKTNKCCKMNDLKQGDIFKLFNSDGSAVLFENYENSWMIAISDSKPCSPYALGNCIIYCEPL